ncbi:class I SAM-dependent methyltransferase [Clostridium sp. CCUG 7971]|uniref:class I SAM-dependent methyltransferase n=1 Tax=Clostridium sp. CCUG 7971 TaxID=2811414 RepID=UPI001ABA9156|nr:class I SAM-dependent methyltransferase [Clostridium sp. CCUG 7971]MBO3443710.1 class I SAM-dependent methyltransferase [Clostridium sp. CCUG 7971]
MEKGYDEFIKIENEIYKNAKVNIPDNLSTGNIQLDRGINWISESSNTILDFGCGSGSIIFYCAMRGVSKLIGIDLSNEGIKLAKERANLMKYGTYKFILGSISEINQIKSESIDAVILSNIIDNLRPNDSIAVLEQVKRILKEGGKVLIKLNPYIEPEKFSDLKLKVIEDDVIDDGMLLWNQTTDKWRILLTVYFKEKDFIHVYFDEYNMFNRMFFMIK